MVATRDIEPLELVMWDNAAALGPRMGTAPVCLQVHLQPASLAQTCEHACLTSPLFLPPRTFLAVPEAGGRELHVPRVRVAHVRREMRKGSKPRD